MADIPPSAIAASRAAKPAPAPAKPAPPPAPRASAAASNSQDDIDALLNGLDEATSPEEIRPPLPDGDVFELTDDMAWRWRRRRRRRNLRSRRSNRRTTSNSPRPPRRRGAARSPRFEPSPFESMAPPAQQILSHSTVSAVESAFNSLANTVLSNNARTLEDLVKEMLRPMLKSWLDDNLPGLVERIVKAEIERVSRGGR